MNKEVVILVVVPLCSMLFALGGTTNKAWRRYILPVVLYIGLLLLSCGLFKALASCGLLCLALHLGYGDGKSWLYRFMVGCAYTIPSVLLGFTLWQVICPIWFITLFWLSNFKWTAKEFIWKICELLFGTLIGITYIMAIL